MIYVQAKLKYVIRGKAWHRSYASLGKSCETPNKIYTEWEITIFSNE